MGRVSLRGAVATLFVVTLAPMTGGCSTEEACQASDNTDHLRVLLAQEWPDRDTLKIEVTCSGDSNCAGQQADGEWAGSVSGPLPESVDVSVVAADGEGLFAGEVAVSWAQRDTQCDSWNEGTAEVAFASY